MKKNKGLLAEIEDYAKVNALGEAAAAAQTNDSSPDG